MAQYPTPQFIESEGKIIFFLTFRQFFLLVGGGAVCLALYYILPFFLFVICSILITGLVAIIAFVKINNMSAVKIFLNFVGFSIRSKNYTWKKEGSPYINREISGIKTLNSAYGERSFKSQDNLKKSPVLKPQTSRLKSIKKMIETKK